LRHLYQIIQLRKYSPGEQNNVQLDTGALTSPSDERRGSFISMQGSKVLWVFIRFEMIFV
jgi:hypothetical protein